MDFSLFLALLGCVQVIYAVVDVVWWVKVFVGSIAVFLGIFPLILQGFLFNRSIHNRGTGFFKDWTHRFLSSIVGSFKDEGRLNVLLCCPIKNLYLEEAEMFNLSMDRYFRNHEILLDLWSSPTGFFLNIWNCFCTFLGLAYYAVSCIILMLYAFLSYILFAFIKCTKPCDPFSGQYKCKSGNFSLFVKRPGVWDNNIRVDVIEPLHTYNEIRNSIVKTTYENGVFKIYFTHKDYVWGGMRPFINENADISFVKRFRWVMDETQTMDTYIVHDFQNTEKLHCLRIREIYRCCKDGVNHLEIVNISGSFTFSSVVDYFLIQERDKKYVELMSEKYFGGFDSSVLRCLFKGGRPCWINNWQWKKFVSDIGILLNKNYAINIRGKGVFPESKISKRITLELDFGYYDSGVGKRKFGYDNFCESKEIDLFEKFVEPSQPICVKDDSVIRELCGIISEEDLIVKRYEDVKVSLTINPRDSLNRNSPFFSREAYREYLKSLDEAEENLEKKKAEEKMEEKRAKQLEKKERGRKERERKGLVKAERNKGELWEVKNQVKMQEKFSLSTTYQDRQKALDFEEANLSVEFNVIPRRNYLNFEDSQKIRGIVHNLYMKYNLVHYKGLIRNYMKEGKIGDVISETVNCLVDQTIITRRGVKVCFSEGKESISLDMLEDFPEVSASNFGEIAKDSFKLLITKAFLNDQSKNRSKNNNNKSFEPKNAIGNEVNEIKEASVNKCVKFKQIAEKEKSDLYFLKNKISDLNENVGLVSNDLTSVFNKIMYYKNEIKNKTKYCFPPKETQENEDNKNDLLKKVDTKLLEEGGELLKTEFLKNITIIYRYLSTVKTLLLKEEKEMLRINRELKSNPGFMNGIQKFHLDDLEAKISVKTLQSLLKDNNKFISKEIIKDVFLDILEDCKFKSKNKGKNEGAKIKFPFLIKFIDKSKDKNKNSSNDNKKKKKKRVIPYKLFDSLNNRCEDSELNLFLLNKIKEGIRFVVKPKSRREGGGKNNNSRYLKSRKEVEEESVNNMRKLKLEEVGKREDLISQVDNEEDENPFFDLFN